MKLFDTIVSAMTDYDVSIEVKEHELVIINRNNNNKLHVYEDVGYSQDMKTCFVDYIVEFSTQHCHFDADDEDDILDYVQLILSDTVLPFEFYMDGKRRFGGEIKANDLDNLSVSFLARQYGYTSDYLLSFDYEIHSWTGKYDTGLRRVADLQL